MVKAERSDLIPKDNIVLPPPALAAAFKGEPTFLEKRLLNYPWAWRDWEHENLNVGPTIDFIRFCRSVGLRISAARDFSMAETYGPIPSTIQHVLRRPGIPEDNDVPFVTDKQGDALINRGDITDLRRYIFGPTPITPDEAVMFTANYRDKIAEWSHYPDSLPKTEVGIAEGVGIGEFFEAYDSVTHYTHWTQKPKSIPEGEGHYMDSDLYKQLLVWMRRKGLIGAHVILSPQIDYDAKTGGVLVTIDGEGVYGCPNAFFLYPEDRVNPEMLTEREIRPQNKGANSNS